MEKPPRSPGSNRRELPKNSGPAIAKGARMRATEKRLRERIKKLEAERDTLERDREKFRSHFIRRFKWWVKLLGESQQPSLPWLIEDDAKFLRDIEKWWWT